MAGIRKGSSDNLTSPIPHLLNADFLNAAARLTAGQVHYPGRDYYQRDTDTHYRLLAQAKCFLADGVTPATQAGTWGTLESHWFMVGFLAAGQARKVIKSDGTAASYQYQASNDVIGSTALYDTYALATAPSELPFRRFGQVVKVLRDSNATLNGTYLVGNDNVTLLLSTATAAQTIASFPFYGPLPATWAYPATVQFDAQDGLGLQLYQVISSITTPTSLPNPRSVAGVLDPNWVAVSGTALAQAAQLTAAQAAGIKAAVTPLGPTNAVATMADVAAVTNPIVARFNTGAQVAYSSAQLAANALAYGGGGTIISQVDIAGPLVLTGDVSLYAPGRTVYLRTTDAALDTLTLNSCTGSVECKMIERSTAGGGYALVVTGGSPSVRANTLCTVGYNAVYSTSSALTYSGNAELTSLLNGPGGDYIAVLQIGGSLLFRGNIKLNSTLSAHRGLEGFNAATVDFNGNIQVTNKGAVAYMQGATALLRGVATTMDKGITSFSSQTDCYMSIDTRGATAPTVSNAPFIMAKNGATTASAYACLHAGTELLCAAGIPSICNGNPAVGSVEVQVSGAIVQSTLPDPNITLRYITLQPSTTSVAIASATAPGIVKIGSGVSIATDGTISVAPSTTSGAAPTAATATTAGVVKIGAGVTVAADGTISVPSTGEVRRLTSTAYYRSPIDNQTRFYTAFDDLIGAYNTEIVNNYGSNSSATSPAIVTRAADLTSTSSNTTRFSLQADTSQQLLITLNSGRLNVYASNRLLYNGSGMLVAYFAPNSQTNIVYENGSAAQLEIASGSGATGGITLNNFNVTAWSNPNGLAATVILQGTTNIPSSALPVGVTIVDQRSLKYNKLGSGFTVAADGTVTAAGSGGGTVGATGPAGPTGPTGATGATGPVSSDTYAALAYAATLNLDFSAATVRTVAMTGAVTFGASANIALGKTKRVLLTNTTTGALNATLNSSWHSTVASPVSVPAGKSVFLSFEAVTGATETDLYMGATPFLT